MHKGPFKAIICFSQVDFDCHEPHFPFLGVERVQKFLGYHNIVQSSSARHKCSLIWGDQLVEMGSKSANNNF